MLPSCQVSHTGYLPIIALSPSLKIEQLALHGTMLVSDTENIQILMPVCHQIRILYLVWLGTLFTTKRPSYDSDAKVHGSTRLQATPADIDNLLTAMLHLLEVELQPHRGILPDHMLGSKACLLGCTAQMPACLACKRCTY